MMIANNINEHFKGPKCEVNAFIIDLIILNYLFMLIMQLCKIEGGRKKKNIFFNWTYREKSNKLML